MAAWSLEAQGLESRRWESSDSEYWFCVMTCSAVCWWRACLCVHCRTGADIYIYIYIYIYTHTHTRTRTHTRNLHVLFHVLDTITVVFLFPLCVRSFISLRISFLFHHIFCFASRFYFLFCFSCCFSFVSSSDIFRNSFQIPQFFVLFISSLLSFFASLSFVALNVICLYFFRTHSCPSCSELDFTSYYFLNSIGSLSFPQNSEH